MTLYETLMAAAFDESLRNEVEEFIGNAIDLPDNDIEWEIDWRSVRLRALREGIAKGETYVRFQRHDLPPKGTIVRANPTPGIGREYVVDCEGDPVYISWRDVDAKQ